MAGDSIKEGIPELKKQDVGGAELPYLYYEGDGPALLLAHATGFLPWLWHPVVKKFLPQGRIWVPYICNYRECDPEKGGLSWDIIAKDLAAFCDRQNINKPLLVGHSMGGTVLTIAAAAYGVEPAGLILIEPIFLPEEFYSIKPSLKDHPLASKSIKRTNHWKNEEDAWSYLKSKTLFTDWDEDVLRLYILYGMEKQPAGDLKLSCAPENEAAMFMGGWNRNPWPLLEKIKCPVLVVEGEKSENRSFIDLQKAVSLFPRSSYKLVPEAGHLIPMQKPEETAQIIKDFIRQIS
ncbi:MAG TPA: alpha/beta hydrolase [Smithellaceae bacterium]|nr:alpha/beta hydrolase [Smithellaceae bacterium]HRS88125.1 alpha/beta hydrolase [Smithellaceae bacterium]HRV25401.1 alpha/beta hydrolase [Smithellaceae bacterium]